MHIYPVFRIGCIIKIIRWFSPLWACRTSYIIRQVPRIVLLVSLQLQEPFQHYIWLYFELVFEMMLDFSSEFLIRALYFEVALRTLCDTWYLRRELSLSLEASKKSSLTDVYWLLIKCCNYYSPISIAVSKSRYFGP